MTDVDDAILTAAAILGALTVIATVLARAYSVLRRIDDAIGTDDTGQTLSDHIRTLTAAIKGIDDRVSELESAVKPEGSIPVDIRIAQMETEALRTQRAVERIGSKLDTIQQLVITGKVIPQPGTDTGGAGERTDT